MFQSHRWFGACGVVRIDVCVLHDATSIDDKARRDWQFPFGVSVGVVQVDAELAINSLQVIRESVHQVQRACVLVVFVIQYIEIQAELADQLAV